MYVLKVRITIVLFATLTKIKSVEPPISDEDLLATQYDHITGQIARRWRHEHKNELRSQRRRQIKLAKVFQSIIYGFCLFLTYSAPG